MKMETSLLTFPSCYVPWVRLCCRAGPALAKLGLHQRRLKHLMLLVLSYLLCLDCLATLTMTSHSTAVAFAMTISTHSSRCASACTPVCFIVWLCAVEHFGARITRDPRNFASYLWIVLIFCQQMDKSVKLRMSEQYEFVFCRARLR